MNLFESILSKAKSGVNYLASGQLGSDVFDATHNEDPTKTVQYKTLQGGANLYTGVKNRLQETVASDMQRKQEKIDKEGADFAQFLADQGYGEQDIMSGLDELKKSGKLTVSPNFSERLVGGLANRMGEVQQTTERLSTTPISKRMFTGVPSYAGDVVGTAFEPIGAALSPVVQKVIEKTGQTQNVEEVGKWWEGVRQSNPNFADAIEGAINVGSLAPVSFLGKVKPIAKGAGSSIVQQAESLVPNLAKQTKKLTSQADMGFRKQAEEIALPKLSEMGMREKQKVTGDVIETKPGLFKKEELVRSPQEALAIEEVSRMLKEGKLKKGGTELQKSTAISDEITGLAEALKGRLDNTPNPVNIPKAEIDALLDTISKNIDRNPFLKAGELDRSAQQIIKNIREQLTKDSYTPSELLDIRKQLDADIKTYKGEKAFSPDIENAFSTTLRDIRQGINNKISELVPDAEVRNFLDRQSALYIARDNVDLKWSKQANSLIGRTLTKIQSATGIPRTEIIELTTALGLLGASSLAPIVTPIAVGAVAISGGRKAVGAILSPKNKARLANVLSKLDEAIKKDPKDAELKKAKELLTNPTKNGGTSTNILRPSNNRSSNPQSVKKPEKVTIVKPSPQVKPVEKVETMTKGEAILYRKNGKIYAKDNQATRDALKRSGIDIEPDGEIKKQLTFYPEDDFRPDVTPKTVKPVEKTVKASEIKNENIKGLFSSKALKPEFTIDGKTIDNKMSMFGGKSNIRLKDDYTAPLNEIVDFGDSKFNELAKKIQVKTKQMGPQGSYRGFTIYLKNGLSPKEQRNVISHEFQHFLDETFEGPSGGNKDMFLQTAKGEEIIQKNNYQHSLDIYNDLIDFKKTGNINDRTNRMIKLYGDLDLAISAAKQSVKLYKEGKGPIDTIDTYRGYFSLGGEKRAFRASGEQPMGKQNREINIPYNKIDFVLNKGKLKPVKTIVKNEVLPNPLSPQKTVKPKNLTEGKQSVTMGDMETKKLIETAQQWADKLTFKNGERKYDYYTLVRSYNDVLRKLKTMKRSRLQNSKK